MSALRPYFARASAACSVLRPSLLVLSCLSTSSGSGIACHALSVPSSMTVVCLLSLWWEAYARCAIVKRYRTTAPQKTNLERGKGIDVVDCVTLVL